MGIPCRTPARRLPICNRRRDVYERISAAIGEVIEFTIHPGPDHPPNEKGPEWDGRNTGYVRIAVTGTEFTMIVDAATLARVVGTWDRRKDDYDVAD
jgi:hypothetical protein